MHVPTSPPFPDPKKWDDIRRHQQQYGHKIWISSNSVPPFPFPSHFIRHQTSTNKFHNYSDANDIRGLHDNGTSIAHDGIHNNCAPVDHSGDNRSDYQYHMDTIQHPKNNTTVQSDKSHDNHYESYETTQNMLPDNSKSNGQDVIGNNEEKEEEEGEEVEVLQVDDFWIKRLSQTVKRMKKKNNKTSKR
mmetsp:Transcript_12624/g.12260  ORF Transcript_12624/g.12260 Transcript_12624/m.12260 type:complete len:189 (+) Transcript_12624:161-727(+)